MNWSDLVNTRARRMTLMVTVFLALLVAISFWLPAKWRVQHEGVIAAPPAVVYPYINTLKKWRDWTVWHEADPDLRVEYSGPEAGVGATSRWTEGRHRGALKIMGSKQNSLVEYTVIFDGGDQVLLGSLRLLPEAHGHTRVVWRAGGEAGANPLQRYIALGVKWWVGSDMERSLERLRTVVETAVPDSGQAK